MKQRIQKTEAANSSLILPTEGELSKVLYVPGMEVSTVSEQKDKLPSVAANLSHSNSISTPEHELNPKSELN